MSLYLMLKTASDYYQARARLWKQAAKKWRENYILAVQMLRITEKNANKRSELEIELDNLKRDYAKLLADNARLVELLRHIEWIPSPPYLDSEVNTRKLKRDDAKRCLFCTQLKIDGHANDCELAKELNSIPRNWKLKDASALDNSNE